MSNPVQTPQAEEQKKAKVDVMAKLKAGFENIAKNFTKDERKKLLRLVILLVAVALVLGYLFLLMGEPEETMDAAVVQPTLQPITIPMSPLDAPAGASLPADCIRRPAERRR